MTRKTLTFSLVALSIALGGAVYAKGPQRGGDLFEMLDTNQDGEITKAEAEAAREARFAEIDTDSDGFLTEAELAAHAKSGDEDRIAKRVARVLEHRDANDDGKLDASEMTSGREGKMFERIDADGDGVITKEEADNAREARGGKHRGDKREKRGG